MNHSRTPSATSTSSTKANTVKVMFIKNWHGTCFYTMFQRQIVRCIFHKRLAIINIDWWLNDTIHVDMFLVNIYILILWYITLRYYFYYFCIIVFVISLFSIIFFSFNMNWSFLPILLSTIIVEWQEESICALILILEKLNFSFLLVYIAYLIICNKTRNC